MTIRVRAVERGRESFLSGQSPPTSIRDDIATSWRRCHHLRVAPDLLAPSYAPDFDPDGALLRASRPVLEHMNERLGDVGISFLLTDASARILTRYSSNRRIVGRLDGVSATEGHVFAEDAVGTNGIGTALELRRPVRVDGHEHYSSDLSQFTCIGVPILGVDRRVNGLLDVSCVADHNNTVIGFIAEQAAEKIRDRLVAEKSLAERALLEAFLAASRRGRRDFFAVSESALITSPRAAQLLSGSDQAFLWEHASRAMSSSSGRARELSLPGGRTALVRVETVRDGGDVVGALVELCRGPEVASSVPATASVPPPGRNGLVGSDPAWMRACSAVADAADDTVVVVCGEPGVGKAAVAAAVHHDDGGGPLLLRDACAMNIEGRSAWLGGLRAELAASPPGTIVVPHIEDLAPVVGNAVLGVLYRARSAGWRCLLTWSGPVADAADTLRGGRALIEIPPLRGRSADIPALATAFAAPRKLAPAVMSLLLRTPWPTNVRALRDTVEGACRTSPAVEVRIADLPAAVRATAYRRCLTRFEHTEIDMVLEAMAECGGNKKAASELLGISRSTLYRKLELAGIADR